MRKVTLSPGRILGVIAAATWLEVVVRLKACLRQVGARWAEVFADTAGVGPKFPDEGPRTRPRLTVEERAEIEVGVKTQEPIRSIARRLGRDAATIMGEIN